MIIELLEKPTQDLEDLLAKWEIEPGVYDIPDQEYEAAREAGPPSGLAFLLGTFFRERDPRVESLQAVLDKLSGCSTEAVTVEVLRRVLAGAMPGLVTRAAAALGLGVEKFLDHVRLGKVSYADLASAAGFESAERVARQLRRQIPGSDEDPGAHADEALEGLPVYRR